MPSVPDNGPYPFEIPPPLDGRETEYLRFREVPSPGLKTKVWTVESKNQGSVLGLVRWFGRWRQYVFEPSTGTLFNNGCLSDIETFLDDAQSEWRESKKHDAAARR